MALDILSDVLVDGIITADNVSGSNTGDQTITLTGGVTGSGTGSFAATVITNANLTGDITSTGNATAIAAGVIVDADINASAAIDATKIADGSVTSTEFQFINTLSSNAQTQITARALDADVIKHNGSVAFTAAQSMGNFKLTSLADGTVAGDAVNYGQLQGLLAGLSWKDSVRVATTVAGTLATSFEDGDVIDGVTLATNDRILIKNQAAGEENGVRIVQASGAPTRATDMDAWSEVPSAAIFVEEGTVNADTGWVSTANAGGTLDTTAIPFSQFATTTAYTGGDGVTITGYDIAIDHDGQGLTFSTGQLAIELDGATLVKSASGIRLDALGTPSSGVLTNCTGLPVSTGISGLAAGIAAFLATPSSANLATAITDETGSAGGGVAVFNNGPTLIAPILGTPASGVATNLTGTASGLEAGTVTSIGNLTGEVTSTNRATVLDKTAITNRTAVTAASGDYVLISDVSDSDNLKKVLVSDFTAGAVKRFSATFGDAVATNFVIAHGLATADLNPVVRRIADNAIVMVDTLVDATNVTLDFNTAPTSNQFRVTLVG